MAENKRPPQVPEKRPSKFEEYFYANLLWWGFLVILALISFFTCGGAWDDITEGVTEFIFVILGGGFTLVSVLDYTFEKYTSRPNVEGKK